MPSQQELDENLKPDAAVWFRSRPESSLKPGLVSCRPPPDSETLSVMCWSSRKTESIPRTLVIPRSPPDCVTIPAGTPRWADLIDEWRVDDNLTVLRPGDAVWYRAPGSYPFVSAVVDSKPLRKPFGWVVDLRDLAPGSEYRCVGSATVNHIRIRDEPPGTVSGSPTSGWMGVFLSTPDQTPSDAWELFTMEHGVGVRKPNASLLINKEEGVLVVWGRDTNTSPVRVPLRQLGRVLKAADVNCEKMPPRRWRGDFPKRYERLSPLVAKVGGGIVWKRGDRKGGVWPHVLITIEGYTLDIIVREGELNLLDRFFIPIDPKASPSSWDDYEENAELKEKAFFLLLDTVGTWGKPTREVLNAKDCEEEKGSGTAAAAKAQNPSHPQG